MNTNEPTTPSDAPTPETDDQAKHWSYRFCDAPDANIYINAEFARRLERERDEARRRITELETELESHAWEISPAMAQAKIDQLNTQLDESRAELAKRSGDSHIDAPPTEGNAVEWVKERLFTQWDDDGNAQWYLCKTDAIELARRADEAENGVYLALESRSQAWREIDALRAQLAAAQTQLAAAQAEVKRVYKMYDEAIKAHAEVEEERDTAQAELDRLTQQDTAHRVAWENAEAREQGLREALWHYACLDVLTSEQRQPARAALDKKEGER